MIPIKLTVLCKYVIIKRIYNINTIYRGGIYVKNNNEETDRIKRGEFYYNSFLPEYEKWKKGESEVVQNNKTFNKCEAPTKTKSKPKHRTFLAIGTAGLILCTQYMVSKVGPKNSAKNIKDNTSIIEIPEDIEISKDEKIATKKAFSAINICNDKISGKKQIKKAEDDIYEYMVSGMGKNVAESVLKTKISQAKLYGNAFIKSSPKKRYYLYK